MLTSTFSDNEPPNESLRHSESCPSKFELENHVLLPHFLHCLNAENQWNVIKETLKDISQPGLFLSSYDLAKKIINLNPVQRGRWEFNLLHYVINTVMRAEDRAYLLEETLPKMARLALELPQLMPTPLPLLKTGQEAHITLSQRQIASLLANAFFCTFPNRNYPNKEYENYPTINFNGLFCFHEGRCERPLVAKLLCVFNYFKRVTSHSPEGAVTFTRRHITPTQLPSWSLLQTKVRVKDFSVDSRGKIEDEGVNMLQVSFANKKFGGGVLDSGFVQEEIRCITCPEMIVARLFAETLDHNEAFLITGVERYSAYTGYGDSFQFSGDFVDLTPRDESGRRQCAVVAIDALNFSRPEAHTQNSYYQREKKKCILMSILTSIFTFIIVCCYWILSYIPILKCFLSKKEIPAEQISLQYDPQFIDRELNKAYVGFKNPDKEGELSPVASGNWGCGIFRGDPVLKFILQLLASSEAGRDLKYFTFGGHTTVQKIEKLVNAMCRCKFTVGEVYAAVSRYHLHGGDFTEYLIHALNQNKNPQISLCLF